MYIYFSIDFKRNENEDFPGGPVVKNLPANAGDPVQSLALEDSTCHRVTKPERYNYRACKQQLLKPAHSRACAPWQEKPLQWEAQAPQLESILHLPQLGKAIT